MKPIRHNRDTNISQIGIDKPTCVNPPHFETQASSRGVSRLDTPEFAPFRTDLDTNQTQAASSSETQARGATA